MKRTERKQNKRRITALTVFAAFFFCMPAFILAFPGGPAEAAGLNVMVGTDNWDTGEEAEVAAAYGAYQRRFDSIRVMEDITAQGYEIVEKHVFDVPLVTEELVAAETGAGEVLPLPEGALSGQPSAEEGGLISDGAEEEKSPELLAASGVVRPESSMRVGAEDALSLQIVPTVRFFTAIDRETRRAAVFLADRDGDIVYKCNQLECNYTILGELEQPIIDMVSVAFQDMNGDGLRDIILIAGCVNDTGDYAGKMYKVGEVLFQTGQPGFPKVEEVSFYRDWRINDKLNRFDMNKSARCIISFVRDGLSTEFLYTSTTETELLDNGFKVIQEQSYWRSYEKLGRLKVLPGVFSMSDYDIFMIYMINEQGDIVWSFQPMGDYDNLYSLRGMSGKDMDGDGMKDLMVVARYSREGDGGELIVEGQCSIYYQRTGGFVADTGFVENYQYNNEETVEELIKRIRAYWGWQAEEETEK